MFIILVREKKVHVNDPIQDEDGFKYLEDAEHLAKSLNFALFRGGGWSSGQGVNGIVRGTSECLIAVCKMA